MGDTGGDEGGGPAGADDLAAVEARISELQEQKRRTVRWHMSRQTAERAIAAITQGARPLHAGKGKSRRRKRHKRLL